jgi:hypothetical protein
MVDKRKLHYWWRIVRYIKVWQLIIVLLLGLLVSVELLRQNNLGMIERRNLVKMADETGNEAEIQKALAELQRYVSSHMNTDMGDRGIYLENTYQRAYERAIQQQLTDDSASRNLYETADAACQAVFSKTYSFPAYTQCVAERLGSQGGHDPLQNAKAPPVDLYRYSFVSPLWTPDAAGIAVLLTTLVALLLLGRIILFWALYLLLRHRHQG